MLGYIKLENVGTLDNVTSKNFQKKKVCNKYNEVVTILYI